MKKGFEKLSHTIEDTSWFGKVNTMAVYMYLLLNVSISDKKYEGFDIFKNETIFSISSLSALLKISEAQAKTAIANIKKSGHIEVRSNHKFSIATLIEPKTACDIASQLTSQTTNDIASPIASQMTNQPTQEVQITPIENSDSKKETTSQITSPLASDIASPLASDIATSKDLKDFKDFKTLSSTTTRAREDNLPIGYLDENLAQAINFFTINCNHGVPLAPYVSSKIVDWCEEMPKGLVLYAMQQAVDSANGTVSWNYLEAILRRWSNEGIASVEEAERRQIAFKTTKEKSNGKSYDGRNKKESGRGEEEKRRVNADGSVWDFSRFY